ncbi:hypothetical protein BDV28DRAFT_156875 [Aspergillus coremiiformis]|uniref:Uncharacterized protein n=1 Tax=Aspergillus coremiiformis TaxID=138285 RepID=A0A5N6Z9X4_9EURO|nr:hypothetical protein BDV28DRAFT_156875 [Aspergillus coremiiformis]
MTGILNGTISSTTVAPLLEILLQDINGKRRRVDSFDVWKSVNTHFGNSDKKIVFPFLDLPCELRLMIYINYFELDTQDPGKRLIDAYRSASRGENRLALMCTNHQIYYEARKVLYQDFTMKLNSACNLRLFFRSLRGYTYTIIRSLHIDGISVEHVNSLAYLLSGTGLMGVRFLTLVATPRYMGPASLEGHATRTRKRLIYPEFKYRLRMAVGKLFSRSEPSSHISPVLILEDFRRDQKYNAVFPDSWNVSASWKG